MNGNKRFLVTEGQINALEEMIGEVEYAPKYLSLVCSSPMSASAAKDALSVPLADLRRWIDEVRAQEEPRNAPLDN